MMATAAPIKRETLKNIGNVPDWVLKQRTAGKYKKDVKKDVTAKVTRPRASSKPKVSSAAPVLAPVTPVVAKPTIIPQPIKEAVKDPQDTGAQNPPSGSKVRRIYSREFLIKFKYSAPTFPPGALTPLDLINQYNKEYELKERQASQDNSSLTSTKPISTSLPTSQSNSDATSTSTMEKKVKKTKKEEKPVDGKKSAFKLRIGTTDDSILRSPLFRATANASKPRHATPPPSIPKAEDKENTVTAPVKRSSSVTKTRSASPLASKKETVKTSITKLTITPILVNIPATATPAPDSAIEATPVFEASLAASDAVMEDAKDDVVDVLTKKLKGVLKETDARRLAQRQKQIDYGKATAGYTDYTKQVAKSKRKREDPKTPNKYQVCSKRSWDGQVRKWRRMLHMYDPSELKDGQKSDDMDEKISFEITEADLLAEENALRE